MEYLKANKLILNEDELKDLGIFRDYSGLRNQLYKANEREDCVLIQGSAFVVKNRAFPVMGIGGIDILDSISQLEGVDGVIGNGNALFVSKDFRNVYSTQTRDELIEAYEMEKENKINFLERASLAPAIFLWRSFGDKREYEETKNKKEKVIFEIKDVPETFATEPIPFPESHKSRLREKFLRTARVVHCARRPTLKKKECLFDSYEEVREALSNFHGHFVLMYTMWNQQMCDAVGMYNTRRLSSSYNPTDKITPHLLEIANKFLHSPL